MSFLRFSRRKDLKVKSKRSAEELIYHLTEMAQSNYSSTRCRGNLIEFELSAIFRVGTNNGLNGHYKITESENIINVEVYIENPYANAQSIMLLIILIAVSFVAYFNSNDDESWIYLIAFPLVGVLIYLFRALYFRIISVFRFKALISKVIVWADEVIEQ